MASLLRLACIGALLCSLAFAIDQTINTDTPEEETILLDQTADTPPISKKQVDNLSLEVIDYALQKLDKKHSKKTRTKPSASKPTTETEKPIAEKEASTLTTEVVNEQTSQEVTIEIEETETTSNQVIIPPAEKLGNDNAEDNTAESPLITENVTSTDDVTIPSPPETKTIVSDETPVQDQITGEITSEVTEEENLQQADGMSGKEVLQESAGTDGLEGLDALMTDDGDTSFLDSLAGGEEGSEGVAGWGADGEDVIEAGPDLNAPEYNNFLVVDTLGEVLLERGETPAKLPKGAYVSIGDTLQTSADSGVVLKYLDSLIILGSESRLYITDIFPTEERNTVILKTKQANLKISNKTEENRITLWTEDASLQIIQSEVAAKILPNHEVYYGLEGIAPIMYHGLEEILLPSMEFTIGYADLDPTEDEIIGLPIYKTKAKEENLPTLTLSGEFNFEEFNATLIASANDQLHERLTKDDGEEPPEILKVSIDTIDDKKEKIKKINYEANRLLENEEYKTSQNLLAFYKKQSYYDKESLFLLGKSAAKNRNLKLAEESYEELLAREESAHRVRLELAAVQFRQKKLDAAKENLEIVKASRPPKKVGENIEQFLSRIDDATPKEFSYTASIGYLYDDNVNAGPNEDTIFIYNLPFTLNQDAKENEDKAMLLKLGLTHNIYSGAYFNWTSNLNFSLTDYQRINAYDTQSFSMSSGPIFDTKHVKFSIPMVFSRVAIGQEYDYYYLSYGLAPQAVFSLSDTSRIKTVFTWHNNDYNDDIGGDSVSVSAGASFQHLLTQSSFIEPSFRYGSENAKTDTNTYYYYLTGLTYYSSLFKNLSLYLNPTLSAEYYQQQEAAFNGEKRKDYVKTMTSSLSYYYESWKLNTTLVHTYTDNSSNLELYDYNRNQFFLFFSRNY